MVWLRKGRGREEEDHTSEEAAILEAEEELRRSEEQLRTAQNRDVEVATTAERLETIGRENHIGPRFFDALGIQRRKRA